MFLLRKAVLPRDISRDEQTQVKKMFGIKRIPQYFTVLLSAMQQMRLSDSEKESMGIICVSHLGPVEQVHKYIDDLLTFPPEECSPAFFSHSVFNAPAAFLTRYMDIRGPSLSVCGFQQIVKSSVLSAYSWLETSYCSKVLMVFSDENAEISRKIESLTGVELFKHTHLVLLGKNNEGGTGEPMTPEELTEYVKQTHNLKE